jgi:uncharacterized OB-fold protein
MTSHAVTEPLVAPHRLEYTYTRSVGPVLGRFFGGLRAGRILGVRAADGRVLVPAQEYDPVTSAELGDMVEVADTGTVLSWAWIEQPRPRQPLPHAFAWALVRLDGADTAMVHAVDAGDISSMRTGMRVRARWREERAGRITDIECFEPEDAA